jgi:hypothetical protein
MLRTGMSGVQGRRWRLKVTDPVYVAFMGATQDTQLEEPLMAKPLPNLDVPLSISRQGS